MIKKYVSGLVLGPALLLGAQAAVAEENLGEPDCTIHLKRTEVSFIISIGGGRGSITCDGVTHSFRVGGLKLGGAGIAGSDASGEVYGLTTLADFNGTYSETKAQATVFKGKNVLDLANSNGVRIRLHGTTEGLDLQLAGGGLKMTLE